tara:strand:+ start:262 stop:1248 length:987 start_codon:yes stop_codon:yes gene_type:complete
MIYSYHLLNFDDLIKNEQTLYFLLKFDTTTKKRIMKLIKLFLLLSLFTITAALQAQDLIVTQTGDSIECAITQVNKNKISYVFYDQDNTYNNGQINIENVQFYTYGYTQSGAKPIDPQKQVHDIPGFRFGGNVGPSYRLAAIPPDANTFQKEYIKKLKWGFTYNFDVHFYINESIGVGVKHSKFTANNKLDDVVFVDSLGNPVGVGTVSDDISIKFWGPSLSIRNTTNNKDYFITNIFIGYMSYHNSAQALEPFTIDGSTLGLGFDFSYDIAIDNDLFLGLQLSGYFGSLSELELRDSNGLHIIKIEDPEDYEGLHRIEFTIGLRFAS